MIATADVDGSVILWQLDPNLTTLKEDNKLCSSDSKNKERRGAVNFSPNGQMVAWICADGLVKIKKLPNTPIEFSAGSENSKLTKTDVVFSPDNQLIAIATLEGDVILGKIEGNSIKKIATIKKNQLEVTAIKFNPSPSNPSNTYLAFAYSNGEIFLVKRDGTLITKLTGHSKYVESLDFSPDGKILASGSDDPQTILWNLGVPSEEGLSLDIWLRHGCLWLKDYLESPYLQDDPVHNICKD